MKFLDWIASALRSVIIRYATRLFFQKEKLKTKEHTKYNKFIKLIHFKMFKLLKEFSSSKVVLIYDGREFIGQ